MPIRRSKGFHNDRPPLEHRLQDAMKPFRHPIIDKEKVLEAATSCLLGAADAANRFQFVKSFVNSLRERPDWKRYACRSAARHVSRRET